MNSPILLRIAVRTILSALPRNSDRRLSEPMLFDSLKPDFPDLTVEELQKALNWNLSEGLVQRERNRDFERYEWRLTEDGWAKEGL